MMKKEILAVCVAASAFAGETAFSPALTELGTRGLSQVQSAEPLGEGRLSVGLRGNAFVQDQVSPDLTSVDSKGKAVTTESQSMKKNATLATFRGSLSYGLNNGVDLFGSVTAYGEKAGQNRKGLGSGAIGMKMGIPVADDFPLRVGIMGQAIAGFSGSQLIVDREQNKLDGNMRPDGYNYFETRQSANYDFQLLGLLSLVFGNKDIKVRMHGNAGLSNVVGDVGERLVLAAGGLEIAPGEYVSIGLEGGYRTWLNKPTGKDPMWITPSLQLKTPVGFNLYAGTDLSISAGRGNDVPKEAAALAPWRAFGGMSASFDVFAKDRAAARAKALRDSIERENLKETSRRLAEQQRLLAEKAKQDSLDAAARLLANQQEAEAAALEAAARQKALVDSLTRRQAEIEEKERQLKLKEDSLGMAEADRRRQRAIADSLEARRIQDSIAMAKMLADEKGKRSDLEKELLKNGVAKLEALYFENGKSEMSLNSKPYMQMVGQILAKYPKLKLEIGGHTDNKGKKAANLKLSTARARAVRDFLVDAFPELTGSLTAKGYGDTKPKANNKTEDGRLQNRRVELKVLNPKVLKEYAQ